MENLNWRHYVIAVLGLFVLGVVGYVGQAKYRSKFVPNDGMSAEKPKATGTRRSAADIEVGITGDVKLAGYYIMRPGSRIKDLIARAGGATGIADLDKVNLVKVLKDGDRIHVPRKKEFVKPEMKVQATGAENVIRQARSATNKPVAGSALGSEQMQPGRPEEPNIVANSPD